MKLKGSPLKNICIILFLFLGVLLYKNIFTVREGISAGRAKGLVGRIENNMKQEMAAEGVPYDAPDTAGLLDQLTNLMITENAYNQEDIKASFAATQAEIIGPAANTVKPVLMDNSFFIGNKFSDVFCAKYGGTAQLENKCAKLSADSCNLTDCCVYVNGTKCMAGDAKGPSNITAMTTDTDYYSYKYQCHGNCVSDSQCAKYTDGDKNVSDDCLNEMWGSSGCTTTIPRVNWWKAQTKSGVSKDMEAWATLPDAYHRKACYGDMRQQWPELTKDFVKVFGNNGTVSCSRYCNGTRGKAWNNELPSNWKGAVCIAAGLNDDEDCNRVPGYSAQGTHCICQRSDSNPWALYD